MDKIICDHNKTPDLSQQPSQNCPKCGNLDQYCQGCALLQKKFKENLFTYCIENGILQDSFEPSNDNTNVVNALQEPFVVKQDPGAHYGYNFPPKVPIIPDLEPFNNQTIDELPQTVPSFDPTCYSKDENSFTYDSTSNLVYDSPNDFNPPSQPLLYSCEFYGNDARYGHYCTPQIDSLFDEFVGELTLLKSIPLGINETDYDPEEETRFIKRLLYDNLSPRPPEEFIFENSDTAFKSFFPSPIPVEDSDSLMEEIDLSFTLDYPMSSGIEEDEYDSKRDILILEEFLGNDSLLLLENESFHFDIPSFSRPSAKPPDGNSGTLNVRMMGDISKHKVPMPRLMSTLVPNQEIS
nr:hypothetical protein [Tanacetum cinerariifolium]